MSAVRGWSEARWAQAPASTGGPRRGAAGVNHRTGRDGSAPVALTDQVRSNGATCRAVPGPVSALVSTLMARAPLRALSATSDHTSGSPRQPQTEQRGTDQARGSHRGVHRRAPWGT